MWFPEWRVLIVDDEPDVLKLSELALKNMEVDGVPVRVFTAASKAEALKVIQEHLSEPAGPGLLTVALIDVVMETDTAGLELCDYIRNTMHNSFAQLYIRTGQPGIAPEREVIDRYDISGYFTKVEATEDKLYTMIKSGVRQYLLTSFSLVNTMMLNDFIATSVVSQEHMSASMTEKLVMIATQRGGADSGMAIWVSDVPVTTVGYDLSEAETRRQRLSKGHAMPLGPMGETIVVDAENHEALIRIPAGPSNPSVDFLGSGHSLPKTDFIYMLLAWSMRSLGTLWEAAGQRVYQQ
jgi:CheY-like chemotaxis protein